MMKNKKSQAEFSVCLRSLFRCTAMFAVVLMTFTGVALAADKPVVVNGQLSDEIVPSTNEPKSQSAAQINPAQKSALKDVGTATASASTTVSSDSKDRQEVYWGYVTLKPRPAKITNRPSRAKPPWKYRPRGRTYQPRTDWTYTPNRDHTYKPKRSFKYRPKTYYGYTPKVWNRY